MPILPLRLTTSPTRQRTGQQARPVGPAPSRRGFLRRRRLFAAGLSLGRGFTAGALTFQGPYGAQFGGEVEGGGLFMGYVSWLGGTPFVGTNVGLEITVYSPDAWELAKSRILNPQLLPSEGEITRRTVTVKGRQAELISIPRFTRPVGQLRLILDLDEVFVVAVARSARRN